MHSVVRWTKLSVLIALLFCFGSLLSLSAETTNFSLQSDFQRIHNRGKLLVGLCELETPPFFYKNHAGELAGIDIKLASTIAERFNVELEFVRFETFDEVVNAVSKNEVDLAISNLSVTSDRAQTVLFTHHYFMLYMGVIIDLLSVPNIPQTDSGEYDYNNPSVKMAVLAGSSYEGYAERHFPDAQRIAYDSWADMIKAVENREVHMAFYDEVAIERTFLEDPGSALKFKYVKFNELTDPISIAVPPGSIHLYQWLQHFVNYNYVSQNLSGHLHAYFSDIADPVSKEQLKTEQKGRNGNLYLLGGLVLLIIFVVFNKNKNKNKSLIESLKWLLSPWAILSGMILGSLYGLYFVENIEIVFAFGNIYLTFLAMCSLPIMITAIISSIGKIFMTSESSKYFKVLLTVFALVLLSANVSSFVSGLIFEPGSSISHSARITLGEYLNEFDDIKESKSESFTFTSFLKRLIPANIFTALSTNDVLSILVFSIILGVSLGTLKSNMSEQIIMQLDALFTAFINIINASMYILPFALFSLMANQISNVGAEILFAMSRFVILNIALCIIFTIIVALIMARRLKLSPLKLLYSLKETLIIAFGTANSYGAMPFAISTLESSFKLDKKNTNLVMPLGLTLCRPGTIINLVLGTVFIAQLFDLALLEHYRWAIIIFGVMFAGVAAAGAPSAIELSMLVIVFGFLGLPVEIAITLLLSIDPITDPFRTVLNVMTSCMMVTSVTEPKA